MNKSSCFLFLLLFIFTTIPTFASTDVSEQKMNSVRLVQETTLSLDEDEVIWIYDFEDPNGLDNWIFYDPMTASQENHWQIDDWEPNSGENSWRCFDPEIGSEVYGGYGNDWMQLLTLPIQDFSAVAEAELNFWFRCQSGWGWSNGATIVVAFGPNADSLTYEIPVPNSGFGDFDSTATNIGTFQTFWPDITVPGWANVSEYTNAVFDLSAYVGNAYVRISFAFASGGSYNSSDDSTCFGFQIDDISLDLDGTVVFADDAEGGGTGGDLYFITGGEAASAPSVPNVFCLSEHDDAPSPTHSLGIETYDPEWITYNHYLECPLVFNAPILGVGESIHLNVHIKGDWVGQGDFPDVPYWRIEVFTPIDQRWRAANWESGGNSVYTDVTASWASMDECYCEPWYLNTLSGEDGIKFRIGWKNHINGMTNEYFGGMYWDNIEVKHSNLEHDIETSFGMISYPTTIGFPVIGEVSYINNGISDEIFVGLWGFSNPLWPVYPNGTAITVATGETSTHYISTVNSDVGTWIPSIAGETTISASHTLTPDDVPENNLVTLDLNILEENYFELGYDDHLAYGAAVLAVGDGPLIHYTPELDGLFDPETEAYDIESVNFIWNNGSPGDIKIHVFEGGELPGQEIWESSIITVQDLNPGLGYETHVADLRGWPALQSQTTSDFYVWIQLLSNSGTGNMAIPQPATSPHNIENKYFHYDGTTATLTNRGWRTTATVHVYDINGVDPNKSALPTEFVLNNAYPNPFNPTTMLTYDVAELSDVSIKVYNVMGQEIATLVSGVRTVGRHSVTFDASNLSSGIYFVQMQAEGFNAMQKIMLMK